MREIDVSDFWACVGRAYQKHLATNQNGITTEYDGPEVELALDSTTDHEVYPLCLNAAHRRKLFFVEQSCVGLGLNNMREGDILCLLFGAATPIILRPTGDGSR